MKLILLISTCIALVSAAPTSVSQALAVPSSLGNVKIALPDGLFPEDKATYDRLQHKSDEKIVPMIIMKDSDFPPRSQLAKKPLYKHQRIQLEMGGPAYKHMGAAANKDEFNPNLVTPFLPDIQKLMNDKHREEQEEEEAKTSAVDFEEKVNRYKNLVAISDDGVFEHIQLPRAGRSSFPESREVEEEVLPQGVVEKKLVGLDKMGRMRFIDVPSYSRAKKEQEI